MPGALKTHRVDLSVIIPVYNNAATLDELIDRLLATLGPLPLAFEVILVDDGSKDESLSILRARSARDPRIRPFALVKNFGSQAAACAALDQARGRWVMSMDADLENCPEDVPAFLEQLERGYDLVCGYREFRNAPLLTRRFPSWLMNVYVRRKTGAQIRDLGCGMKGCQAWLVHNLEAEGEARRLLPPLLLQRARTVTEVPVRQGASHKSGGHSFLTLFGMAADYYLLSARRPFLVAGLVSASGVAASAILLLAGALLAALILATSSFVGLLLSLVGEYCQRIYQLTQRVPFYKLRDLESADGESRPDDLPDDEPRRATPM
jgi:glycosyltransferase involved in cell wall biosynthesis